MYEVGLHPCGRVASGARSYNKGLVKMQWDLLSFLMFISSLTAVDELVDLL